MAFVYIIRHNKKYKIVGTVINSHYKMLTKPICLMQSVWDLPRALRLPEYYNVSSETIQDLRSCGYKICNRNFAALGMTTVPDYLKNARNHNAFRPTDIEVKKIGIIRKTIQQLRPYLENEKMFYGTE